MLDKKNYNFLFSKIYFNWHLVTKYPKKYKKTEKNLNFAFGSWKWIKSESRRMSFFADGLINFSRQEAWVPTRLHLNVYVYRHISTQPESRRRRISYHKFLLNRNVSWFCSAKSAALPAKRNLHLKAKNKQKKVPPVLRVRKALFRKAFQALNLQEQFKPNSDCFTRKIQKSKKIWFL